ncbi:hypothetical protein GGTG_04608 [Gaeumannomyces tritici R3-111a-1]|uniref:Uncharacterized protein n=1 Tax=Gaeumannomyces tritici (strain R3-111a-1) TaxID=644352 RepID=J3NTK8_GAET3|nr:hypothetical protein GGTG_04608 [Gaeumannomyces tritici R3-111a-1]EJT79523.1 hypothetical protein GGTG_04608 [Gaeumannomyces tritici R3-111a-1]
MDGLELLLDPASSCLSFGFGRRFCGFLCTCNQHLLRGSKNLIFVYPLAPSFCPVISTCPAFSYLCLSPWHLYSPRPPGGVSIILCGLSNLNLCRWTFLVVLTLFIFVESGSRNKSNQNKKHPTLVPGHPAPKR